MIAPCQGVESKPVGLSFIIRACAAVLFLVRFIFFLDEPKAATFRANLNVVGVRD